MRLASSASYGVAILPSRVAADADRFNDRRLHAFSDARTSCARYLSFLTSTNVETMKRLVNERRGSRQCRTVSRSLQQKSVIDDRGTRCDGKSYKLTVTNTRVNSVEFRIVWRVC